MLNSHSELILEPALAGQDHYEAPRVELVLSSGDIERQVAYAGVIISCNSGDCAPPPEAH